jgi:hypothetical protein
VITISKNKLEEVIAFIKANTQKDQFIHKSDINRMIVQSTGLTNAQTHHTYIIALKAKGIIKEGNYYQRYVVQ